MPSPFHGESTHYYTLVQNGLHEGVLLVSKMAEGDGRQVREAFIRLVEAEWGKRVERPLLEG
jgi:hypothetical protein